MQTNRNLPVCRRSRLAHLILAATLTLLPSALTARAQSPNSEASSFRVFHLTNVTKQNDANEILIAIRNMVNPRDKIYLVASQNAIVMEAPGDQLALAQKLIDELDKPHKIYRLTYTLTAMDGSKPLSMEHYSMVVADGLLTSMKQGSKIPIVTGTYKPGSAGAQTQYQYLDIGMSFDATVTGSPNHIWLTSKVAQTSLAPEKSGIATDPVVRQASVEGSSLLVPGKPLVLGSLAIPNTPHHLQVEVEAEPIS